MSGRISAAIDSAVTAPVIRPVLLAEFDFSDGVSRVWSGVGTLSWGGHSWLGMGHLGSVEGVEETTELKAVGVKFRLSGIPSDLMSSVTTTVVQGRRAKLWLALMSENWTLIDQPVMVLAGKMDTVDVTDGGSELSFELAVENSLRDLQRPRARRYTDADQQAEFPGDKGMQFCVELQRKEFKWGTKTPKTPIKWSSFDKAASITLSETNLTATQSAESSDGVRATQFTPIYFEVYVSSGFAQAGVSIGLRSTEDMTLDGNNAWGSGVYPAGTVIGVCLHVDKIYLSVNGIWFENAQSGVPAIDGVIPHTYPTAVLIGAGSTAVGRFKEPWWHAPPDWLSPDTGAGDGGPGDSSEGVG